MASALSSPNGEQIAFGFINRLREQTWVPVENPVCSHSTVSSLSCSLKMQLAEVSASPSGWLGGERKLGTGLKKLPTGSALGRHRQCKQMVLWFSPSSSVWHESGSFVLFGSTWKGIHTVFHLTCQATSKGSAYLEESLDTKSEWPSDQVEKRDGDVTFGKQPWQNHASLKKMLRLKKGKLFRNENAITAPGKGAGLGFSSFEGNGGLRVTLKQLGVSEEAIKYSEQVTGLTEDDLATSGADLMMITGVGWMEAIAMLLKRPSLSKIGALDMKERVAFFKDLGMDQDYLSDLLALHPALLEYNMNEIRKVVEYLISVGIPKDELPGIFWVRPQVLSYNSEEVQFSIACLLEAGVPPRDLIRVLKKVPELFSPITRKNLKSRIQFFKQVGLDGGALGKGIARRPNLLNFNLDSMKRTHEYLQGFMSSQDLAKLIRRFAEVLVLDPNKKMEPIVHHLLRLGVKRQSLGKVLLRRPQLLGYTVAGLEPTLQYLKELGVKEHLLGKVISISPQVLTLNCEEKLKPVVEYLRSIGLDQEGDMERLLIRNAQILCCSIERNIRPKFQFFQEMGLSTKDVIRVMVLFPSMFGQSIEGSLAPKYQFLVNVMKRSPKEILDFPQYFGYSLEKRIKPRYEKLAAKGIHISLPSMLACIETDFQSRYLVGDPPSRAPYRLKKLPRKSKYADL